MSQRLLCVVVCGAGPAAHVDQLVSLAHERRWNVQVVATPSAIDFIDEAALESETGRPVRSRYRRPGEPRSDPADAIVVAPATFNTINKLADGISDTYALGLLAEAIGLKIPVVIVPFINSALASRRPLIDSLDRLRREGVEVLFGSGSILPHAPGTGEDELSRFPWGLIFESRSLLAIEAL